MWQPHEVCV